MDKENQKSIFNKLRELRRSRGLTVDTLATKIGENSQKVARVERGDRSLTLDYLVKVSKALETPITTLIEEEERDSFASTDLLNNIVLWVEEHEALLMKQPNPKKKAHIISKIFELASNIPADQQPIFLNSLLDGLKCLCE